MKRWKQILPVITAAFLLAACGQDAAEGENASNSMNNSQQIVQEENQEMEIQSVLDTAASELEAQMIQDALMSTGNNYRIKKVFEKAKRGEDVTIAFIGGSITEGYNAGTTEIYAKLTYDYIKNTYGTGENVHYVNAGLSGTPSILGLIRSDRDVFQYNPDLLFIEFAVNDGANNVNDTGFESLIVKGLSQSEESAVVLLFSVTENGYNIQDNMNLVAFPYDLPRVSAKNAIWKHIEAGEYTWDQWSNDESHPNADGQLLYSKFIIHMLQTIEQEELDAPAALPARFNKGFDHTSLKMVDRSMNQSSITITSMGAFEETGDLPSFPEGWTKSGTPEDGNDSFCFTFTGKSAYIVYKDNNSDIYGTAEVYVDGEKVIDLQGNSSDGWGNPVPERIYRENESGEHQVEIRMSDADKDKKFAILAIGIVP